MSTIDINFETIAGKNWLVATCAVAAGWGAWKNGFGYYGHGSEEFVGDRRIKVWVNLIARPNQDAPKFASEFPASIAHSGRSNFSFHDLRAGRLEVFIPIEHILNVAGLGEREGLKLRDDPVDMNISDVGDRRLELCSRVTIDPPRGRQPGITREFDTQFFQGGLPSLGRR